MSGASFAYAPHQPYLETALDHARAGIEQSVVHQPRHTHSGRRSSQEVLDDLLRRTNLAVQLANGQISHLARFAELQPKMCTDGSYPAEFRLPMTVDEARNMDGPRIDRILTAYRLPTDVHSLTVATQQSVASKLARMAKLCTLFDFLGAAKLSEYERYTRSSVF